MSKYKRQHPIMIFFGVFSELKSFILPFFLVIIFSSQTELFSGNLESLWITLAIVGVLALFGFLRWFFYSFKYSQEAVDIKSGIIIKNHRHIKKERIQTINLEANIFLQLFDLVQVKIHTAGGLAESELDIKAMRKSDAIKLKDAMNGEHETLETEEVDSGFLVDMLTLFKAGATSGGVGVMLMILSALLIQILVFVPIDEIVDFYSTYFRFTAIAILVLILITLFSAWVLSILRYALRYAFFTVRRIDDSIDVQRGLLVKKQLTLKRHRVQSVVLVEGLLRQPLNYSTLEVKAAGAASKDEQFTTILHPLIKKNKVSDFLTYALDEYAFEDTLTKLPKKALRRYIIRSLIPFIILIPVMIFVPYAWLITVLIPFSVLLGVFRYKDGATFVKSDTLTLRFRNIARVTALIKRKHIQNITLSQTVFQQYRNLASLSVTVLSAPAHTTFTVNDVELETAQSIKDWV